MCIAALGQLLRAQKQSLGLLATQEMGKPITQAVAEIEKCANLCDWYAENGPAMLKDGPTLVGPHAYVSYLPIGPVLAIMPWNFPYWQILRGAMPIVLAGNSYVLKHAPNVQAAPGRCSISLPRQNSRRVSSRSSMSPMTSSPQPSQIAESVQWQLPEAFVQALQSPLKPALP